MKNIDIEELLLQFEVKEKALEFMAKDLIKIYYGELFQVDYIITKYESQAREELMKEKFVNRKRIKD